MTVAGPAEVVHTSNAAVLTVRRTVRLGWSWRRSCRFWCGTVGGAAPGPPPNRPDRPAPPDAAAARWRPTPPAADQGELVTHLLLPTERGDGDPLITAVREGRW